MGYMANQYTFAGYIGTKVFLDYIIRYGTVLITLLSTATVLIFIERIYSLNDCK